MATGSALLIDEYFDAADERFVDELLSSTNGKKLKNLAARWYRDGRPFARRALLRYIDDGCDRPHHRPLVKALFKLAEKANDDEAIGHFMAAFDRLVRRKLTQAHRWNRQQGSYTVMELRADASVPGALGSHESRAPKFSRRTRLYLCRRAFRYFRVIARTDVARYGRAIRAALPLYRDEHLDTPERILDAWGLMHALYWGSPVLVRDPRGIKVAAGRSLGELEPAPFAAEAWRDAFDPLFELLERAKSRTVRVFAIALLRRDHADALRSLPLRRVRNLLRSPNDEVQTFAAELLRTASGVQNLSVEEWLELLKIENPSAIPLLCELVEKTVRPERLSLAQTVALASAQAAPVAELGLRWTKQKPVSDEAALTTVLGLARAGAPQVRAEAIAWVTEILAKATFAKPEHVRDLLDARFADVRAQGLALVEKDARFSTSIVLWGALSESPYDDARAFLVKHLRERERSFGPEALRGLWATTLLAVHRGGRAKRTALNQIAARVAHHPSEAESLLPLLGIALRSVRAPERRTAIAAVASAVAREPAIGRAVARLLPELKIEREAVL
ncbi:hypothetical protein A7982_13383 [Minicystis rosea]|nr:hypothetical protein A7982_13383 [Minicystis rosea]